MDGAGAERWSGVADEWAEYWGGFARPAWGALLDAARTGPGTRVLDVGCGSGELLAHLAESGAVPTGVDPAPGMVAHAAQSGADVRSGDFELLPFGDAQFDVVLAVNSLQFAADTLDALAEASRVLVPGGVVGVACWAEGRRNDLDVIERAVAAAYDEEVLPDGALRLEGGLEGVLVEAGLNVVAAGLVEVPWTAADDGRLVHGVLFGEEPDTIAELAPVVLDAARPFRAPGGGYLLHNAFRWALARTPGVPASAH